MDLYNRNCVQLEENNNLNDRVRRLVDNLKQKETEIMGWKNKLENQRDLQKKRENHVVALEYQLDWKEEKTKKLKYLNQQLTDNLENLKA